MTTKNQTHEFSFRNFFVPFTTIKAIHWIVFIGLLLFFNGLINTFVADDLGQIVQNVSVHSLQNIPTFFSSSTFYNGGSPLLIGNYYRPLLLSLFACLFTFFGPNYVVFHFVQLFLHISNTIFLFFIFLKFFKKSTAFVLSIIFLVHPVNSESVLYVSDTQEVLFFFFGILSLWVVHRYRSYKKLFIAWFFVFLSLLSKETGILFVGILLVYIFLFEKKRVLIASILGISFVSMYLVLRTHAIGIFSTPKDSAISFLPLVQRLIQIPSIILFYLHTFVFPFNLSVSYQWIYTHIDLLHFWFPLCIDLAFFAVIIFCILYCYKMKSRTVFFTFVFFSIWLLGGLVLHLQIIPLDATVGDRWFYFPIVGFLGMIGIFLEMFHINWKNIWILSCIGCILLALGLRTFVRTFDFRDEMTLALHDSRVSPDAYNLKNILSFSYFQVSQYNKAQSFAQQSIQLHPFMTNYLNLGAAYFAQGKYTLAKKAFLTSLKFGDIYQTYDNLALLGLSYGNPKENMLFIKTVALKKYPHDGLLWLYLAALEYNFVNKENARRDIQQAYMYDPEEKVAAAYNAILHNQPVRIRLNNK